MMSPYAEQLIAQFDAALARVSSAEQFAIQRQMTDLFLGGADSYSPWQIAIFDGVMGRLIERSDRRGLLEFTGRLAMVDTAPALVIGRLSMNDDIAVAGPVLEKSNVLTDENLVAVAKSKSQDHLLAIACRARINEIVTDVLVERGNAEVARKVVANLGARFSDIGFVRAIQGANSNEALRAALAIRQDVPPELLPFLRLASA
jgi:uncharacterized protein (DUF2336 family)